MQLSAALLELARTHPQQTRLYLSVFTPSVVMQCRVNDGAIAKGARTITYDSVSLGSSAAVEPGMTLLVGTSIGGREVGRLRIRSASASAFTVAENSNIDWSDNLYLTVLRYWEVWPIFPRLLQDPADPENVIFYKDYDIAYSNQNSILGTFVNAGPHRAALLDAGQAQLYYSSSGTYPLATGVSLSYQWAFEGGTPSGSASPNPGYVSYAAPGHYVTRLYVSGSNGSEDVTYRYVSIYDRPGAGSQPPILKWEMQELHGSREEGESSVSILVHESIQVDDNSVVVIFSEDWYGDTKQSFGGNAQNASGIFFVGYVEKGTIEFDYKHNSVEFVVNSITGLMKDAVGFAVSVQSESAPDTWYKLLDMNGRKAIYHYLKWHTTVLSVADFQFVGDDQNIQYFDADRASMYDAVDSFMRLTYVGSMVSDRQGKLWAETDAESYSNPTGSFPSLMSVTKRDWIGAPSVDERVQDEESYLEYGGIAYSGVQTGTFDALLACAPGEAPSPRGKVETLKGLAIAGQTHLNALVGSLFANKNSKYDTVRLRMSSNFRNFDLAPQEAYQIHLDPEDTPRGEPIDILGVPHDVTWSYDSKSGLLVPTITFKSLVSGPPGDSIFIPPPEDVGNGFNVPGLVIPPISPLTFSFPSGTADSGLDYVDVFSSSFHVVSTIASRGYWGPPVGDSAGLWVPCQVTGLFLIIGWIEALGTTVVSNRYIYTATDGAGANAGWTQHWQVNDPPPEAFLAARAGAGWGTIYQYDHPYELTSPRLAPGPSVAGVMMAAVARLTYPQSVGIGLDNGVYGALKREARLQIIRLSS